MKDDWGNPTFAERWDRDNIRGNPVRLEQLDILVSILADRYKKNALILDLGMGSGQFEEILFERCPEAFVIGIDFSPPMTALAHQRLQRFRDRYTLIEHDLNDLETLELPAGCYQFALSIQTLHEIPHTQKRRIYSYVYNLLDDSGTFFVVDRVAIDTENFYECYESIWDRWERINPLKEGIIFEQLVARYRSKKDYPATLEEHLEWLRSVGFKAACIHLQLDRVIISAQKVECEGHHE